MKEANERSEAEIELRLVIDSMPSLIAYVDSTVRYRLINRAYEEFFGVKERDLIGKHVRDGVGPKVYRILQKYIDIVLTGKKTGYNEHYEDSRGVEHYLSAKIIPYIQSDDTQNGYLVIVDDVTEQRNLQLKIEESNRTLERRVAERTRELEFQRIKAEELASHDPLTGVLNRRSFFDHANIELSRAKRTGIPFSIAMLDIDYFKRINDDFGHSTGDEVLVDLTKLIVSLIRAHDLIARIGGEEFVVVTPESTLAESAKLMERLRMKISERGVGLKKIQYTSSIGITEVNPHTDTIESALKRADKALYDAKKLGRNKVVCV